jgi:hypothetical protein
VTNKIFLSYGREELGFVDDLVGRLETEGYDVWLDYRELIPGQSWTEQLEKGKNESDTILLVVSKKSVNSQWVQKEWQHFLDSNKRVILLIRSRPPVQLPLPSNKGTASSCHSGPTGNRCS